MCGVSILTQKYFLLINALIMFNLLTRDQESEKANVTLMAIKADQITPIFYYLK